MYLYETHLHTSQVSACAESTAELQVRAYYKRGYAGLIVTDHFLNGNTSCPRQWPWEQRINYFMSGYEAARTEGVALGMEVFLGWEYCCADGTEFLTYGLDVDFLLSNPGMDMLDIEEYSALIRENGGYLAQAHPFRTGFWISNQNAVDPALIDGVEVFNASMPDSTNQKAYDFARLHNLPIQAGSDSHNSFLPFSSGVKLSNRAEDVYDLITAIKLGSAELITP